MTAVRDMLGRPLRNLRLSVTDRCNLRCSYCMPEAEYTWLPRADILDFEEIGTLVDAFIAAGAERVRLTGGEPLLRRGLPRLVELLAQKDRLRDLSMTTNGVMLAEHARSLRDAGLHRVTVSLDTLHADRFESLARVNALAQVLEGIAEARRWFADVKLDAVIMRGTNEDELVPLVEYARAAGAEIRFIEYMDVGGATRWTPDKVVSRQEMLEVLSRHYGQIDALLEDSSAPADRFRLVDGTVFGIISSTTDPFCRNCDRSRLTADGMWYRCLYAARGTDLRSALRSGAPPDALRELIIDEWTRRADRGAEDRLSMTRRTTLLPAESLRKNPHLEMHTRGG